MTRRPPAGDIPETERSEAVDEPAPTEGPALGPPFERGLPRYRTGDDELDRRIADLVATAGGPDDAALVFELIVSAIRMQREDVDRRELKIANYTLKEMRYAFHVFAPYHGVRKVSVFGSARTPSDDPSYVAAADFSARIAERDWMVITGAGPGIMQAGIEGAGRDASFGVNIQLPFEQVANSAIAGDPKLINFRYFFTRKLTFVKESDAFCLLPGGFGTMDEAFELLTLLQTGKAYPSPVVLLDPPGSTYWERWQQFVEQELVTGGLINAADLCLVHLTDDIDDAIDHIERFYRNYHSMRYVRRRLVIRHRHPLTDEELNSLGNEFASIMSGGGIERAEPSPAEIADDDVLDLHRFSFVFDQFGHARLRQLIDRLNELGPDDPTPGAATA
ncbi:LOG family protein [Actinomarinicola tropica]|uniref:TIGR00730 family Rossman fold protein n=1 Tax=Actinomarinicola tropica TaxID=2789776 RepID=A0A5Q2RK74_9ACTN|nr:TIGR00730 family Rossman fold protein [Actinomarinicola tropica]QGG95322.1 TIGR00730 family Rossman fold protein [Actinomarinicola tropica]